VGVFNEIPDETYKLAGEVIRYASGAIKEEPYTPIRDLAMIVAGAAVAMEKAEVTGPYFSRNLKGEDWLKEGSLPWRSFHGAVAQVLDKSYASEIDPQNSPEKIMRHIVSDTLHRTQIKKMDMEMLTPGTREEVREEHYKKHFPGEEMNRLERYKNDHGFREESAKQMVGSYHALPEHSQKDLFKKLTTSPLDPDLEKSIAATAAIIRDNVAKLPDNIRQADERLADYREYDTALFEKVTPEVVKDYKDLTEGKITPQSEAQAIVVAHNQNFRDTEARPTKNRQSLVKSAHLQFLADHHSPVLTRPVGLIEGVSKIENHIATVEKAGSDYINMRDNPLMNIEPTPVHSHVEPLTPNEQMILFESIEKENLGVPLNMMKVAVLAHEINSGESLSPQKNVDRSIVFENMDEEMISMVKSHQLDDLYRKGDKVRLAEGPTGDKYQTEFLDDVMTIKQTVVVGGVQSNGMGGTYPVMTPQYEFEGINGRWPAVAFQHERGDEHAVAVIMERHDRLWMVPLTEEAARGNEVEVLPAREIKKTDFPLSMDGYDANELKKEAAEKPIMGEFTFRPIDGYKKETGPVELSFIPWSSGASEAEVEKAAKSIDNVVAEERHLDATKHLFRQISSEMGR
jgi:hypothetical protein